VKVISFQRAGEATVPTRVVIRMQTTYAFGEGFLMIVTSTVPRIVLMKAVALNLQVSCWKCNNAEEWCLLGCYAVKTSDLTCNNAVRHKFYRFKQ
jgi:hypothetical protein